MAKRPNILFILADDQGAWSLGCAGNREILTPNLDALAAGGMRLENCFCASPVCSPARASILTGMMPSGHGVLDWIRSGSVDSSLAQGELAERYIDEDKPIRYLDGLHTWPEVLAANGYTCALCGKWHLGDSLHPAPGFSHWYTIGLGGCPYYSPDIVENGAVHLEHRYITDLITEQAVQQLEQLAAGEQPFYLSVHYTAPHSPWDAASHPEEVRERYRDCAFESTPDLPVHPNQTTSSPVGDTPEKRREYLTGYYAAITAMDAGIGRILHALEEAGEADNTLVVFTADNGICMGHHGVWGKGNATFPQNMYEQSVKIPCILRGPGVPAGVTAEGLYSHCDLYPTLLEYAGIRDVPQNPGMAGRSFAALLQGEGEDETRDHVLIFEEYGAVRMVRAKEYKYVHRYPFGPCELYHLPSDPDEQHNLIDDPACTDIVTKMQRQLYEGFAAATVGCKDGLLYPVSGKGQRRKLDGSPAGTFWTDPGLRK